VAISDFIEEHPALTFGIGFVGALVIWTMFTKKQGGAGTSTSQDLSGLGTDASGNHVVYVPTSTSFSTSNIGADYSNDPALTTISNSPVVSNSPISTSQQTTTVQKSAAPAPVIITKPAPPPPVVITPKPPVTGGTSTGGTVPVKAPPVTPPPSKGVKWNYPYIVRSGDTLSQIATNVTNAARQAGAPSNTTFTYQQIYNYNKSTIDSTANAHGNPVPGGPWNNIFPGEKIWLPTWS
jgi:hypothetical protein